MNKSIQSLDVPAHIELAFEHGVPVSVNGIAMSLDELNDIVAIIAGDHGVGTGSVRRVLEGAAEQVLGRAREALAGAAEAGDGIVRMKLHHGEQTVLGVSPSSVARPS